MNEKTDKPAKAQATPRAAKIPPSDQMYFLALARSQRILASADRPSTPPESRPRPKLSEK